MGLTAQIFGRDVARDGWPAVAVVMPVRNEEHHLENAVKSILAQDYPEPFTVCLAVGTSDDATEAVADRLAAEYPSVSVVANPSGVTPAGLNAAIAATTSDVVVRVDGHSALSSGYIQTAVETMIETGAVNVGGIQRAVGTTAFEKAVAAAMTSRIGTGGAKFHIGGAPGPVDTVYLGVFDRAAGNSVGWFDERLIRNQDYELNIRLRNAGGTIWFMPDLAVEYQPRATWASLAKQYYEYGFWKAQVAKMHPRSLRLRQVVPAALVPALLTSIAAAFRWRRWLLVPTIYLGALIASTRSVLTAGVLATQHLCWSVGALVGAVTVRSAANIEDQQDEPAERPNARSAVVRNECAPHRGVAVGGSAYRDRDTVFDHDHRFAEVHLVDNFVHLLMAAGDLAGRPSDDDRLILFIDDRADLDERLRTGLATLANARVQRISDAKAVDEFSNLPQRTPAIVRRNLRLDRPGRARPNTWLPAHLRPMTVQRAYIYHPGFFLSKVLAGVSDHVTMRDSGYCNYVELPVDRPKQLIRLIAGYPPRRRVWGEERWIDEIEVALPAKLPDRVAHKASSVSPALIAAELAPETSRSIASLLWGDHPLPDLPTAPRALLLTQPLDDLGFCTSTEKISLYADLADQLSAAGYEVVVKDHPRDTAPLAFGDNAIPQRFPIEGWPWLGLPPFDISVSLNSTSLLASDAGLATRAIQLVAPDEFYAERFDSWARPFDLGPHLRPSTERRAMLDTSSHDNNQQKGVTR